MLIVETIAKIRRLHFTEGKGIKTICRDLKLSKKVVRKVIRTGITEFTYTRTVQPRPKLGAWLGELNRLLEVNAARARGRVGGRKRLLSDADVRQVKIWLDAKTMTQQQAARALGVGRATLARALRPREST